MKKLTLLCLFLGAVAFQKAYAQPSFYFTPDQIVVDENDPVCFSLEVEDFTNIIEITFTIAWDPGVMEFTSLSNFAPLPGLGMGNFDTADAANGIITFQWDDGQPCESALNGPTLDDFEILFDICFIATGIYGNHTPICITDEPMDMLVRRSSAFCADIGEFTDCGFCSIGTPPLTVNISSGDGFQGDVVCLDFEMEDFDNIVSFQYGIFWDETILQYVSSTPSNLEGFTGPNSIGTSQVGEGILNLSWLTAIDEGIDVPDGTSILEVCFEILGDCGDNATVFIAANPPAPVEVVNGTSAAGTVGTNIGLLQTEGEVSVNCFDPDAITMNIDDREVCPGENFTVDVTVTDFENISKLQFNLKWNPNVIDLNNLPNNGVTYPGANPCFNFGTAGNVSVSPGQGLIEVDWEASGAGFVCDLPDDYVLMRLHFTAVGSSGSNTTIAVINPIFVDVFGGQVADIGINNNNSLVEICELNSPTISASSAQVGLGEAFCLEFTVQDFDDILRTQYSLSWDNTVLNYTSTQSYNLSSLSAANFLTGQTDQGFLGVEWENSTPVSVPDGTAIFEVCFEAIGDPDECTSIDFVGSPWVINVQTSESSGTDVGLNGQPGNVCIENPLDFFIAMPDVYGSPGTQVCLDVTAEGFVQMTQMQYTIIWNFDIIEYSHVAMTGSLPNFTAASYDDDISNTEDGQLVIDWVSNNSLQGTTLPDETVIFQICFTVVGVDGQVSGVGIGNIPQPVNITAAPTGNVNLGMGFQPGSVTVSSTISIFDALVTPLDCPTVPSGAIDLMVEGGSESYIFEWAGPGVNPSSEDQFGLFAGQYFVTVTDANNPALVDDMTITVGLESNAPVANAGQDTTFNCFSQGLTLNGTGSSNGADVTYLWHSDEVSGASGVVDPFTQNSLTPVVFGGEYYVLTVTDTLTGCVDTDTVFVDNPVTVNPAIAPPDTVTCGYDTIFLDGGGNAFGFDVLWETPDGNLVPGSEDEFIAEATQGGMYILTFSNDVTGCAASDTVVVQEDFEAPTASAGMDETLGCQDEEVQLDGSGSSGSSALTYEWSALMAGEICDDVTNAVTAACAAGMYQLTVTLERNGCTALDTVMVEADTLRPTADAGPDLDLDCITTQVVLDGSNSSQGADIVYVWSDGTGVVGNDMTLDVTVPGNYLLEVLDTSNGCSAISPVTVQDLSEEVLAVANTSGEISCLVDMALLTWNGSALGTEYIYEWQNPSGVPIATADSITVTEPGIYTLVVTDTTNQCTGDTTVTVADLTAEPTVDAGADAPLGCIDFITLSGNAGPDATHFIYQWQTSGVGCITDGTTLTPQVECSGVYTLVVQDTMTGCVGSAQMTVVPDDAEPGADALAPSNFFPCDENEMLLSGSSDSTNVSVLWTSVPTLPIVDETTFSPTISGPGVYMMTVTSNDNSCTSQDTLVIEAPDGPVADAGQDDAVDCLTTEVTLSAANSTLDNTTLTWTAISGDDPTNPNDVDITVGAGEYLLTVVDQDGCTAEATVEVIDNADLPAMSVGGEVVKACDEEFATLTGTADAGLTYTWRDGDGMIIGSELTQEVALAGTYYLTVFNLANGCESIDSAVVTLADAGPLADAATDHDPCADEAMLMGNLPEGATGVWAPLTGASVDVPEEATTLATGFAEGVNLFTWTLSLGTCIDYSTDTLAIVLDQSVPDAVADFATLDELSNGLVTVNVLDNDVFDASTTSFALLDNAGLIGSVEMADDGTLSYTKEKCYVGPATIEYELCNAICPDLCDSAVLTIDVLEDGSENCDEVPNAITPNDDGVNDELVFDILLSNPDAPDNELVVFNRWGDIVFQAKPYLNDWRGTNENGDELPHGTYYYILKLDIANGDIVKGDMTILK